MNEEKIIKILEGLEEKLIKIESTLEKLEQQKSTNPITIEHNNKKTIDDEDNDPMLKLAEYCEISIEQLRDIIDYENDNFILLKKIEGKSSAEKQLIASLCLLTAWAKGMNTPWISTLKLGDAIREASIDTKHLGENITKTDYFVLKGSRRGAKYHITTTGWQKGLEILKSLATKI